MSTLEETVRELQRHRGGHDIYTEYSQRGGLSSTMVEFEASAQRDVDSGLISLLSEDEESDSRSSSPTVGLGGTTPTDTATREWADASMTGHRERPRQRSLHQSPPRRDRSRSRSPLRQNAGEDGTSRRVREHSPPESTCTSRTARRSPRPVPFTSSSPSASSTSANTCRNSDSSVVQVIERRQNGPPGTDDSSSEDSPRILGEIWHNATGSEVMEFDRIPERAVFWTPPGATHPSAYFGDRRVQQWLNRVMGESASGSSSNHSSSSINLSSSSSNSSSSPSTSC